MMRVAFWLVLLVANASVIVWFSVTGEHVALVAFLLVTAHAVALLAGHDVHFHSAWRSYDAAWARFELAIRGYISGDVSLQELDAEERRLDDAREALWL